MNSRPSGPASKARATSGATRTASRVDVEQVFVELDPPASAENHVELLGARMAMHEGRPLARVKTEMRQARLLRVQISTRDPRFPPVAEAVGRRRIADIRQIDSTVWASHLAPLSDDFAPADVSAMA